MGPPGPPGQDGAPAEGMLAGFEAVITLIMHITHKYTTFASNYRDHRQMVEK